ncbi:MAG TPA: hypothetical protein VM262_14630, partial [Acidimicrobiales bacterium]|nr:hypothetical protein [Acidimicrobiales bacterium]
TRSSRSDSAAVVGTVEAVVVEVGDDDDFSGIALDPLDASEDNIFQLGDPLAVAESREAPPASGVALLLWLVLFPAAVIGLGWWLVRRRSSTAVPSTG